MSDTPNRREFLKNAPAGAAALVPGIGGPQQQRVERIGREKDERRALDRPGRRGEMLAHGTDRHPSAIGQRIAVDPATYRG